MISEKRTYIPDRSHKRPPKQISPDEKNKQKILDFSISKEILDTFHDESSTKNMKEINIGLYFVKHRHQLKRVHILHILHESAKAHIDISEIIDLSDFATILQSTSTPFRPAEFGKLMYSLHIFDDETVGIQSLLDAILPKLRACAEPLSGYELGNAYYGMQGLSCSNSVANILTCLLPAVISCDRLKGQEIGNALFGFRNMASTPEVLLTLSALSKLIERSEANMTAQGIVISLNGLQGQRSQGGASSQPEEVLRALVPKMLACKDGFTSAGIGSALLGLQGFSDSPVVREVLGYLHEKLNASRDPFDLFAISTSIHGLHSLSDDIPEVREILNDFANKLNSTRFEDVLPSSIAHALFGLRRMSGQYPETKRLLSALNHLVVDLAIPFNETLTIRDANLIYGSKNIAKALYGLQLMSASKNNDVKDILRKMALQIQAVDEMNAQEVGMCLYGLKGQTDSSLNETKAILSSLAKKIVPSCEFSAQSFGMCLLGLRGLSSNAKEVGSVLTALTGVVSPLKLDAQAVGNALYGLQSMYSTRGEVRQFLTAMTPKVKRTTNRPLNAQEISNALWGLQGMNSDHAEVKRILETILDVHLEVCEEVQYHAPFSPHKNYKTIRNSTRKLSPTPLVVCKPCLRNVNPSDLKMILNTV